jgi:agmatine deiminase
MATTPAQLGYYFPAEWHTHEATWLSFPHNTDTFPPHILQRLYPAYLQLIATIAQSEKVRINVNDVTEENFVKQLFEQYQIHENGNVEFYHFPTNDAWCRDHGPAFLINPQAAQPKAVVNWEYNAWGGKYPPFDDDNQIPVRIAQHFNLPLFSPQIIMEGGSVEFNGKGTLLTTTACLLNKNRNPHLSKVQIEQYLCDYYGVKHILWLGDGIEGDDTDGHIDDITRFVNEDTVVTVVEPNQQDDNFEPLQENLKQLRQLRLENGKQLNIVELPMPQPVIYEGLRIPASYANFCITNKHVIVPTYRDEVNDKIALDILSDCFKDRVVVGIDSTDITWGLGSFHCLSQQEPKV